MDTNYKYPQKGTKGTKNKNMRESGYQSVEYQDNRVSGKRGIKKYHHEAHEGTRSFFDTD
jgi:hypothetical protein